MESEFLRRNLDRAVELGRGDPLSYLRRAASTKIRTGFIGAIATVEGCFGSLWGHDQGGPQTEEEWWWFRQWQACRHTILDNGNDQIRRFEGEVDQVRSRDRKGDQ